VKITYLRGSLVIPFILFLVYFGAYAEKNALFDVGLVLVFGALGWVMVQTGWHRPPLILGLVLGRLTERYLFLSVNRYEWDWLARPWVIAFGVVILGVIAYSIWREWRGKGGIEEEAEAVVLQAAGLAGPSTTGAPVAGPGDRDGAPWPTDQDGVDARAVTEERKQGDAPQR